MENEIFKNSRSTIPFLTHFTNNTFNKFFFIRLFLGILLIIMALLNTLFGFILPQDNLPCFLDKSFTLTESINNWLTQNQQALHSLLISSSLCMDITVLAILTNWVLNGKSWRLLIILCSFYSFRAVIQVSFIDIESFPHVLPRWLLMGVSWLPVHYCFLFKNE
jgi:hypothetical protein